MAQIKFSGNWCKEYQGKVPKGILALKVNERDYKLAVEFIAKLNEYQNKKQVLKDLDVSITYHYKKRTIDQNKLMWSLYTIEANEQNAGMEGDKSQNITPQKLYEDDITEFAPAIKLQCHKDVLSVIKSEYKVIGVESLNENMVRVTALITTSKFNTIQMAHWVDRIFNRLSYNGVNVTTPGEIEGYWLKWKQHLNSQNILLHTDNSEEEYRRNNPNCEACGKFIGDGSGQLAHIKSKGAGGKDQVTNRLHLCHECHIQIQHSKGWDALLEKHSHLYHKVNSNLVEDIKEIFDGEIVNDN